MDTAITVTVSTDGPRLVTASDGRFSFRKWSEYASPSSARRAARRLVARGVDAVTARHWGHLLPIDVSVEVQSARCECQAERVGDVLLRV